MRLRRTRRRLRMLFGTDFMTGKGRG